MVNQLVHFTTDLLLTTLQVQRSSAREQLNALRDGKPYTTTDLHSTISPIFPEQMPVARATPQARMDTPSKTAAISSKLSQTIISPQAVADKVSKLMSLADRIHRRRRTSWGENIRLCRLPISCLTMQVTRRRWVV